jgi:hypothetical protein
MNEQDRPYLDGEDSLDVDDAERSWLAEYGSAALSICCGLGSMVILGAGLARASTAGVEFWDLVVRTVRVATVLAGAGTLAGIWGLSHGRSIRGLTLCGGLLIACAVLWAWILGYLRWI